MSGVPQSKTIKESHNGLNDGAPPSVNKQYQILAKTTTPAQPWNGAGSFVEFEIPDYLGKITDAVVQFDIVLTSTGSGNLTLTPTTLWCDRIETLYGSVVVESQDADQVHMATMAYLTDQEYNTIRSSVNAGADGGFNTAIAVSTVPTATITYYLPLWTGAFHSFQPFCRGFKDNWRIRLWFAKNGLDAGYSGTGSDVRTIQCPAMSLWLTEAQLSESAVANLANAHKNRISYRGLLQSKFTQPESAVATTSEYRKPLTTFVSDTAGLLVFSRPNSSAPVDQLTKNPLQYVALLDAGQSEIVQRLPDGLSRYFIQPDTVPIPSYFTNNAYNSFYVLPLCANLQEVLETGAVSGGLRLSGQEIIALLPKNTLSNVIVTAHSYEYAVMDVVRGKPSVQRRA
jgi:hypothetical protein